YPHAPQDNGGARSWIPSLGATDSVPPPILSLEQILRKLPLGYRPGWQTRGRRGNGIGYPPPRGSPGGSSDRSRPPHQPEPLQLSPTRAKAPAENAHANGLSKPIMVVGSNLLSALTPRPLFDVILSSPPSFAGEPRDVADRAWYAGPNYRDIARLFNQARKRLAFGGCMYVLFSTDS